MNTAKNDIYALTDAKCSDVEIAEYMAMPLFDVRKLMRQRWVSNKNRERYHKVQANLAVIRGVER